MKSIRLGKGVEQENYANATLESRKIINAEAEAIHMILNGIGDDIYSTVDACDTARDMWLAIERLQQGESINKQDVKTKLFWEFGKFTSKDRESIESYYTRFYKMMNEMQQQDLDIVSYQILFDILKQHQHEVNEIHAKKIARNASLLALVAADQHYPDYHNQAPKLHKTNAPSSRQTTSTRSHATTKNKGKEMVKTITTPSESASEEESNEEQTQRDKQIQKSLAHIAKHLKNIYKPTNNNLRTSSNTKNVDTSLRTRNDRNTGQSAKPKRAKDYACHKEKMMEVLTANSGPTYDAEPFEKVQSNNHYNVFATKRQHSKQLESINDTYVVETVDSNVTPDSLDKCDNEGKVDQNTKELEDECVLLASLIANLKLDIDENKKAQKYLKKANMSLTLRKENKILRKAYKICLIAKVGL
ncbi:hypothetical protein Tco_1444590 [Tanacetum coccineum]